MITTVAKKYSPPDVQLNTALNDYKNKINELVGEANSSILRSKVSDFWGEPFWSKIPDKPSTYPPSSHDHNSLYYLESEVDTLLAAQNEFKELADTPSAYTGHSLKNVRVNVGETGLEFIAPGAPGAHASTHHVGGDDLLAFASITGFGTYLDQAVKQTSSPAFATVKLTGLTDGYVPYHVSDAAGLANSPIFIDGTNVGIGTASPGSPLHVKGVGATYINIDGGVATSDVGFRIQQDGTNRFLLRFDDSEDNFEIYSYGTTSDVLSIAYTTGNVGIGKVPTCKLDVNGTIKATQFYLKLDDLLEPDDNIDLNVSINRHGLFPKLINDYQQFMGGTGQWTKLVGSTGIAVYVLSGASTTVRNSNDTERTTTAGSYTKIKEVKMGEPTGVMKIYFTLESVGGELVYGRIYKNGGAIGTAHSTTTVGTWNEDLGGFDSQDLIQIYAYAELEDIAKVKNMRFGYDRSITHFGDWEVVTPISIVAEYPEDAFIMQNQDPV